MEKGVVQYSDIRGFCLIYFDKPAVLFPPVEDFIHYHSL